MAERRITYLAFLAGALVFYWAYREWLSWMLLMCVLGTPWVSLLLSLPAMLRCRLQVSCVPEVTAKERTCVSLAGSCPLPMPPVKGILRVCHAMTGKETSIRKGAALPTGHCGFLTVRLHRAWCYDYLGLFRLPIRKKSDGVLLVRPRTVTIENPPDMSRYLVSAWKPKAGGGFAENHELRLYRPGDSLRQVHWKLSAKTGKLVYREPMEALRGLAVLTLRLSGTPAELDDKLGKLRYISGFLIKNDIPHRVCCLTGDGLIQQDAVCEEDVLRVLTALLRHPPARENMEFGFIPAAWRYHVGGDGDEA